MSKLKKVTLPIQGMNCQSCDILVKDKFCEVANVKDVEADYRSGEATISYRGHLDTEALQKSISQYGYRVLASGENPDQKPLLVRVTEASVISMILFILYFFAQDFNLIPSMSGFSELNYGAAFILGLVASASTCMATSGALFMTTIGKLRNGQASFRENIVPAFSFNVGRVLSYGAFGFVFGLAGSVLTGNATFGAGLTLFVSVAMILVALDMLQIFSVTSLMPQTFTKGIFEKLEAKLITRPKQTAFFLGAITYLLPCGFTQSVQLFALSLGSPVESALLMMAFAIGTIPALLAVGSLSSFTRSAFYPMFSKVVAVLILLVGGSYFLNFLTLQGISLPTYTVTSSTEGDTKGVQADSGVTMEDGKQVVKMNVRAGGYEPNAFTVKQGIPVKWVINGENVFGCQGSLIAPQANIQAVLKTGENIFEFTPMKKGQLNFSCSMGMYGGSFTVI